MATTSATHAAAPIFLLAALIAEWRVYAKRFWSYVVYCLGYRLLSFQLDGSVVAAVVTFGLKQATAVRI